MMEMTDQGGIGNPAFDGDDVDKKERKSGEGLKVSQTDGAPLKEAPLKSCYSKVFNTAIGLVIFLSWAATMQGIIVNGLINVVITTLERRFGLQSATSGWIAGFYDIGSLLTVIPVTYFGGRKTASKPRYISVGLFIIGCGSFLFFLPHIITEPYMPHGHDGTNTSVLCDGIGVSQADAFIDADQTAEDVIIYLRRFKWFFLFGQFLHGVGAAPLITLGTTVLDESVDRLSAPLYIGIFQTFLVIGPAIGYIAGGSSLSVYVDFDTVNEIPGGLSPKSNLWVGAWWTCFIVAWVLTWLCGLGVFMFPPKITPKVRPVINPGGQAHKASVISARVAPPDSSEGQGYGHIRDLPRNVWLLLKNPTYVFISLGAAFDGMCVAGLSTFGPKYIQAQFGYSASFSSTVLGLALVPAGGLGTFTGGWVAKRFKLSRYQILVMYIVCQLFATPFLFGFYSRCHSPQFDVGGGGSFNSTTDLIDIAKDGTAMFEAQCNANCGDCNSIGYKPVCGADRRVYFSACYAGCTSEAKLEDGSIQYSGCTCVSEEQTASDTSCLDGCSMFPGLLVGVFGFVWFTFMAAMPTVVATLRYVEPVQRSLAMGISTIFFRIFGSIPGPVVTGSLFDYQCQLTSGSCLIYDNNALANTVVWFTVGIKLVVILIYSLTLYTAKHSQVPDETEDGE